MPNSGAGGTEKFISLDGNLSLVNFVIALSMCVGGGSIQ